MSKDVLNINSIDKIKIVFVSLLLLNVPSISKAHYTDPYVSTNTSRVELDAELVWKYMMIRSIQTTLITNQILQKIDVFPKDIESKVIVTLHPQIAVLSVYFNPSEQGSDLEGFYIKIKKLIYEKSQLIKEEYELYHNLKTVKTEDFKIREFLLRSSHIFLPTAPLNKDRVIFPDEIQKMHHKINIVETQLQKMEEVYLSTRNKIGVTSYATKKDQNINQKVLMKILHKKWMRILLGIPKVIPSIMIAFLKPYLQEDPFIVMVAEEGLLNIIKEEYKKDIEKILLITNHI